MGDPIAGNHASAEPSSVSSTLLERIKAHRPEAWERLVDLYGPVVYRWCRQYGLSRAKAVAGRPLGPNEPPASDAADLMSLRTKRGSRATAAPTL